MAWIGERGERIERFGPPVAEFTNMYLSETEAIVKKFEWDRLDI